MEWGGSLYVLLLVLTLAGSVSPIFIILVLPYGIWVVVSTRKVCSACGWVAGGQETPPDRER